MVDFYGRSMYVGKYTYTVRWMVYGNGMSWSSLQNKYPKRDVPKTHHQDNTVCLLVIGIDFFQIYTPKKTDMTGWEITICYRRYIFIHGCFSIVIRSFSGGYQFRNLWTYERDPPSNRATQACRWCGATCLSFTVWPPPSDHKAIRYPNLNLNLYLPLSGATPFIHCIKRTDKHLVCPST